MTATRFGRPSPTPAWGQPARCSTIGLGARLALERATVLHPRYALPFAWLGYLAYQEGDQAVAAMLLKKAIFDLGPPDATVAAVARYYVDKI